MPLKGTSLPVKRQLVRGSPMCVQQIVAVRATQHVPSWSCTMIHIRLMILLVLPPVRRPRMEKAGKVRWPPGKGWREVTCNCYLEIFTKMFHFCGPFNFFNRNTSFYQYCCMLALEIYQNTLYLVKLCEIYWNISDGHCKKHFVLLSFMRPLYECILVSSFKRKVKVGQFKIFYHFSLFSIQLHKGIV